LPISVTNNGRTVTPSNFYVSRFTQAHVNAGQVQYLHNGVHPTRDSIIFNVSVEKQMIGPFTLFINIVDDEVELSVSNITVVSGSSETINSGVLRAATSAGNDFEFRIFADPESGWLVELSVSNITVVSGSSETLNSGVLRAATSPGNDFEFRIFADPESGWLVRDSWNLANISTIKQFSAQELDDRRIFYVNNPTGKMGIDSFTVAACTVGTLRCTEPKQVIISITHRNLHSKKQILK
uniref:Cadherin domain-containing protein n=1 Tax=Gongylonema pulchrum TaxID=637853 RepID=A0A183EAN1_9BILA